jgi:hypothetical protein
VVRSISLGLLVFTLAGCAVRGATAGHVTAPTDDCMATIPLAPGRSVRASTQTGLDAHRASCARGTARECAFALDVTAPSELRAVLETSNFDGVLTLYEDEPRRELRCVDDAPPGDVRHARLETTLQPGKYQLLVDGANGEAGDFQLFTELEPLPEPSRVCEDARPLTPGTTLRESTRGGRHLFNGSCGGGEGPEHVHRITLDHASRIRVRQQSEYDGSLYLRAECTDPQSELACNDDLQGHARSLVTARLAAGTYYLFSDSYARDQSGDYVLTYERVDAPHASSVADRCRAPGPRGVAGLHEVDTLSAPGALAGSCGGEGAPEVLVPLQVDAPMTLVALLEAPEFNAVLYLRRACEDAQSELACWIAPRIDGVSVPGAKPAMIVLLEPGRYVLVIDGLAAGDLGAATLHLLLEPPR